MSRTKPLNDLGKEIQGSLIQAGSEGIWTQAIQQAAIHQKALHVEVSMTQFFDAIGSMDAVTSARTPSQTNGSGICSTFATRTRKVLGHIYTGNQYDSQGQPNKLYVLNTEFAATRIEALSKKYKVFEVTAAGFDSAADTADELVFRVAAVNEGTVKKCIEDTGATFSSELPSNLLSDVDFFLPRQAIGFSETLLEKASEHRNISRPVA